MFYKITSVAAMEDYTLLVGFSTGEYKQFDCKPLIAKYKPFEQLTQVQGLFGQVRVDVGGYGIVWNDDLDISSEGLYEKGIECKVPDKVDESKNALIASIVNARRAAGLSQKQLEVVSGVAQPCIARMEAGNVDPKVTTILKLLEPLGLTLAIVHN